MFTPMNPTSAIAQSDSAIPRGKPRLERYLGRRLKITSSGDALEYTPKGETITFHAIFCSGHEPWFAACAYLRSKAFEAHAYGQSPTTVLRHAEALCAYATFLESEGLQWDVFPNSLSLKPPYRFRGYVLKRVDARTLKRSTAAHYMSVVRAFYGWAMYVGAIADRASHPYRQKTVTIRYTNAVGLVNSKTVVSSDLAIRKSKANNPGVEDGCLPLRLADRDHVLSICKRFFRDEFTLAISLGFFSGMRIGTIVGLTHKSLRDHFPSPDKLNWYSIRVGPDYGIPTKGGVNYTVSMPEWLLSDLLKYATSERRFARVRKSAEGDKDLLFPNQNGKRMTHKTFSSDMTRLRRIARTEGLRLGRFHIHDTRATFGTAIVLEGFHLGQKEKHILPRLMRMMGHTSAQSSYHYISWVEDHKSMDADEQMHDDFFGLPDAFTA